MSKVNNSQQAMHPSASKINDSLILCCEQGRHLDGQRDSRARFRTSLSLTGVAIGLDYLGCLVEGAQIGAIERRQEVDLALDQYPWADLLENVTRCVPAGKGYPSQVRNIDRHASRFRKILLAWLKYEDAVLYVRAKSLATEPMTAAELEVYKGDA